MKTEYTPGPWELECRESEAGNHCGINVTTEAHIICRVPDGACVCGGYGFPHQLANARLIAAAPDLLNALELAEATINRLNRHNSANGTLDVIKTAISKAKGE